MGSQLDGIIGALDAATLRRLAQQYRADHIRALQRADYLEAKEKLRRRTERMVPLLGPAQKKKAIRDARDLEIVRKAWAGKSNKALAGEYGLSAQHVSRILKSARTKAIHREEI